MNNLVTATNLEWADNNVGIYLYESVGISSSYVVDADDRPVYTMTDGETALQGANLRGALLAETDFGGADLREATVNLKTANLPSDTQTILRDHAVWVEASGAEGRRAVLSGHDLSSADLSDALLGGRISATASSPGPICRAPLLHWRT